MCIELGFIDVGLISIGALIGLGLGEIASLAFKDYLKAKREAGKV